MIKVLWGDQDGLCMFTKRLERSRFVWPVTRDGKIHLTPALLQEQQTTIRKMADYNRLLSQRVAAYASEINRLKALVAKLQRMQFGKSSEKLREKT